MVVFPPPRPSFSLYTHTHTHARRCYTLTFLRVSSRLTPTDSSVSMPIFSYTARDDGSATAMTNTHTHTQRKQRSTTGAYPQSGNRFARSFSNLRENVVTLQAGRHEQPAVVVAATTPTPPTSHFRVTRTGAPHTNDLRLRQKSYVSTSLSAMLRVSSGSDRRPLASIATPSVPWHGTAER